MKKRLIGLALLTLAMLAAPGNASADSGVDTRAELSVFGFGVLDIGLLTADLTYGAQKKWPPRLYSGFETIAAGAQFAYCLDQVLSASRLSSSPWEIGAAIGAMFLAHGVLTLLRPWNDTEMPPPPTPVTIAPLALSDVARASVPGMAVLGRF